MPIVIILPECELNHCCRDGLKKALQMVCEQFHSNNFHKAFEGFFLRRKNIQTLQQAYIYIYLRAALLHNSCFLLNQLQWPKINWVQHIIISKAVVLVWAWSPVNEQVEISLFCTRHLIGWIWKCWNLLFQFCLLIGFHCLDGPDFSKCTVNSGTIHPSEKSF